MQGLGILASFGALRNRNPGHCWLLGGYWTLESSHWEPGPWSGRRDGLCKPLALAKALVLWGEMEPLSLSPVYPAHEVFCNHTVWQGRINQVFAESRTGKRLCSPESYFEMELRFMVEVKLPLVASMKLAGPIPRFLLNTQVADWLCASVSLCATCRKVPVPVSSRNERWS